MPSLFTSGKIPSLIGAKRGFIYIRGEYRYVLDIVQVALDEAYQRGYLGQNIRGSGYDFDLLVHTGEEQRRATKMAVLIHATDTASAATCLVKGYLPRKAGNIDCTLCLDCVHACPHDNIGLIAGLPGATLWHDRPRSGIGRLSQRTDIAALVLVLVFGAFANAAALLLVK